MSLCEKTVVLYHAGCMDGFGAALVSKYFSPNIITIPVHYNQSLSENELESILKDADVLMFDITFEEQVLEHLVSEVVRSLNIYDHHKSAYEKLSHLPYAHFDMDQSGAMLAWNYFYPTVEAPPLIQYIQDSDLYRWSLTASREINAYLQSLPMTFNVFTSLLNSSSLDDKIEYGREILRCNLETVHSICKSDKVGIYWMGDLIFASVNSCTLKNQIAEWLYTNLYVDFTLLWYYDAKANCYRCSLRSANGKVDVSVIASLFGGGGHPHAAGMTIDIPPHLLPNVKSI